MSARISILLAFIACVGAAMSASSAHAAFDYHVVSCDQREVPGSIFTDGWTPFQTGTWRPSQYTLTANCPSRQPGETDSNDGVGTSQLYNRSGIWASSLYNACALYAPTDIYLDPLECMATEQDARNGIAYTNPRTENGNVFIRFWKLESSLRARGNYYSNGAERKREFTASLAGNYGGTWLAFTEARPISDSNAPYDRTPGFCATMQTSTSLGCHEAISASSVSDEEISDQHVPSARLAYWRSRTTSTTLPSSQLAIDPNMTGGPDQIAMMTRCIPDPYFAMGGCTFSDEETGSYSIRMNLRRSQFEIRDTADPSASWEAVSGGIPEVEGGATRWYRPGEGFTAIMQALDSDSGVRVSQITSANVNGGAANPLGQVLQDYRGSIIGSGEHYLSNTSMQCDWAPRTANTRPSVGGSGGGNPIGDGDFAYNGIGRDYKNYYYTARPCQPGLTKNVTASLRMTDPGEGNTQLFNVMGRTSDASGNARNISLRVGVDRVAPSAPVCAVPGTDELVPAAAAGEWWTSRVANHIVRCTSTDADSGVHTMSIRFRLDGGAEQELCSATPNRNGNQQAVIECDVNASSILTQRPGTRVTFSAIATDRSGTPRSSAPGDERIIDSAGPEVSTLSATRVATRDDLAQATRVISGATERRWTNQPSTTVSWTVTDNPSSGGTGVGMHQVYAQRRRSSCDSAPAPAHPGTALGTAATSTTYANDRSTACEQGEHAVVVRARDGVGNWSTDRPGSYFFDSIAPGKPTVNIPIDGYVSQQYLTDNTNRLPLNLGVPAITDAERQSPYAQARFRIGEQSDPASITTCTSGTGSVPLSRLTGTNCATQFTLPRDADGNLTIDGGTYTTKVWLRDVAGNEREENFDTDTVALNLNICKRD